MSPATNPLSRLSMKNGSPPTGNGRTRPQGAGPPQEYILDKGGHIFIALYRDEPVGVCALCKKDDPEHEYELAKLAVSPWVQGKGIGVLLCRTVIGKAKELGCKKIFLESNTLCARPYGSTENWGSRKFRKAIRAYERVDIQMELVID